MVHHCFVLHWVLWSITVQYYCKELKIPGSQLWGTSLIQCHVSFSERRRLSRKPVSMVAASFNRKRTG